MSHMVVNKMGPPSRMLIRWVTHHGYAWINKWYDEISEPHQQICWSTRWANHTYCCFWPHITFLAVPKTQNGVRQLYLLQRHSKTPFRYESVESIDHLLMAIKFITTKREFSEDFFRGPYLYFKISLYFIFCLGRIFYKAGNTCLPFSQYSIIASYMVVGPVCYIVWS